MLEPPGTMRTPSATEKEWSGLVDLSKKGSLDESTDISTMEPRRKPRRIPFLTQALVRQPVGEEESGSAARRSPRFRESLKDEKSVWCSAVYADGGASKRDSI